jgi:hypothetical protein
VCLGYMGSQLVIEGFTLGTLIQSLRKTSRGGFDHNKSVSGHFSQIRLHFVIFFVKSLNFSM